MLNALKNLLLHRRPPVATDALPFHPSPEVKAAIHADGIVLIHLSRGIIFSSNRVGAMIWNDTVQHRSIYQMTEAISQAFAVEAQIAHRDVTAFIDQLATEGLLVTGGR
jgi:hypothetical protein